MFTAAFLAILRPRRARELRRPRFGLGADGRLGPCPSSPNCVCSESGAEGEARIAAFEVPPGVAPVGAFEALADVVGARAEVTDRAEGYLRAVFKTRLMRFRDDFEARLDAEAGRIHVRSASRLGYSDLGANRKRVEALRSAERLGGPRRVTTPAAEHLPVDDVLAEVVGAMEERRSCVLVAPPGAGKTTRVPPALAAAGMGAVWCLEPRRIAARAAARRVAAELGCRVGERVGHHVRFDRKFGPATEVVYCTEGMLLARLQEDPSQGIGAIVFDEFHERSLDRPRPRHVRRTRAKERADLCSSPRRPSLSRLAILGDAPIVRPKGSTPYERRFSPERAAEPRGGAASTSLEVFAQLGERRRGRARVLARRR